MEKSLTTDTAERVKRVVVELLTVEPDHVVDNANFEDDLGADSLDRVELIMMFEEEFDISIPDHDADQWTTVRLAVAGIVGIRAGG